MIIKGSTLPGAGEGIKDYFSGNTDIESKPTTAA